MGLVAQKQRTTLGFRASDPRPIRIDRTGAGIWIAIDTAVAHIGNQRTFRQLGIQPTLPLAVIVLMASAEALLNSFFFYPAILAAGALTPRHSSLQEAKAVEPC
jgi:hypothetical protein